MIEVREVRTAKERRDFLEFPLKLYAGNPCFVPPLYGDEKKIFSKNYVYYDTCEAVYYIAYRDGKPAGRISGILQKASNEIRNEKRVRFTRFDVIDDAEVSKALFGAVEKWALEKGMDTICGPLGFSDLEREGLLVSGFDMQSTFEEQYNAEYYMRHIEALGYEKEVDWLESRLYVPDDPSALEELDKMADFILRRYHLRFGEAKNVNDFINRYADQLFELLDKSYSKLYGTVPFTDGMKKMIISNFRLAIDLRFVAVLLDENDRVVCLGVCFPGMADALAGGNGKLTPGTLLKLLKVIKHPRVLDLGLVGVEHEYLNRGLMTVFMSSFAKMIKEENIEYAETNLNLEDNFAIRNQWKRFKAIEHKRRRSYVKKLSGERTDG
ncbi:MAG: hypothetical protein J6Z80_00615 [Clostridia bacterium]|nr:hypothetical protein [Clostridia bacterium]